MTKGKPWTMEEEQTLIQLVKKGKEIDVISRVLKKPEDAIYMKLKRLGLEVVVSEKNQLTTTTDFRPSGELPSVENVIQRLSAALVALEAPGLEKQEIVRLRCLIQGFKIYKELFADFVRYCDIEAEQVEIRK